MKNLHILPHFRPDEHPFIERSLDWIRQVTSRSQVVITPFLDPREQFIIQSLARRETDIVIQLDGGYKGAERCRARLFPDFLPMETDEFPLVFLRLSAESSLEHRDVLGSLLGLGLKRQVLGDILLSTDSTDVILAAEMREYVQMGLTKVGKKTLSMEEINRDQLIIEQHKGEERQATVSSLRIDSIIAVSCRLSRAKAVDLIRAGRSKVNWQTIERPDFTVAAGDVLSIRGYGRIQLLEVQEMTKKGRFPIRYSRNF
jgi:RNA-binding protein YlmH